MRLILVLLALALPAIANAAPFDPEAATQAYLATLTGTARAKSDAYFEGGYWLILWGALVSIAIELLLLRTGVSARFRDWAEARTTKPFVQSMLYALPYTLAGALLILPWTIYTGFVREGQYGLMNQGFGGWFGEWGINLAIGLVMTAPIIALIVWGIRRSPQRWWIGGTAIATLIIAFLVMIGPVFISPLFNDYTELKPGPVRDRIVAMAQSQGVPADHIYVFDQSKQHKRISANVSGLGPTIRISLNDNLLNRADTPEIAAVMGHELGHYVLNHIQRLFLSLSLLVMIAFFVSSRAVPWIVAHWGNAWRLRGPTDVAAIPVYSIVITLVFTAMTPLTNTLIRTQESEADAFGLDVAREPDGFARTAIKLSEYRKLEPGAIEEMLFYDHPSGRTRVRMAMDWKAANPAPAPQK